MQQKRREFASFLGVFFLLVTVCIVPLLTNYTQKLVHTVTTATGERYPLGNGETVSQIVHLQGGLKKAALYLSIDGVVPEGETVTISLSQGEIRDEVTFNSAEVAKYSGYREIELSNLRGAEGTATLEVTANGTAETSGVSVWLSSDRTSGLPAATLGTGERAGSCLAVTFTIRWREALFVYKTVLLTVLVALCAGAAYLVAYRRQWLDEHNWALMALVFLMIVAAVGVRQPAASFYGEPRSEAAYDFWQGQVENGFWASLMRLEAGLYLSWLERIITCIAVKIFPTKYVFVGIQMLGLTFISSVSAAFCTKPFRRYFGPVEQVLLSLFIGLFLYSQDAYMFHMLGYWGIYFILFFCLYRDMEEMPLWVYISGLVFTAILCLSKLLYAALLPVAVFNLIPFKREREREREREKAPRRVRHNIYWLTVIGVNAFHILYVFAKSANVIANRTRLGSFVVPPLSRLFENLIYYQVEMLIAALTKKEFSNGLFVNVVFLGLFAAVVVLLLYFLFVKKKEQKHCIFLISCGLFSLGTIGIDILSGAGTTDMRAVVDWNVNFTGNSRHYIFCHVALLAMVAAILSLCRRKLTGLLTRRRYTSLPVFLSVGCLLIFSCQYAPTPVEGFLTEIEEFPTEWQKQCWVTENESYYLPINTGAAALASLHHNSGGVMYGYNTAGEWAKIPGGSVGLDASRIYFEGDIEPLEREGIVSLMVHKANNNFRTHYTMQVYDSANRLIAEVPQSNSEDRLWLTFLPEEPIYGTVRVRFVYTNTGTPAPVRDGLNIGVVRMPA